MVGRLEREPETGRGPGLRLRDLPSSGPAFPGAPPDSGLPIHD